MKKWQTSKDFNKNIPIVRAKLWIIHGYREELWNLKVRKQYNLNEDIVKPMNSLPYSFYS